MLMAQISLTFSYHLSLLVITFGKKEKLQVKLVTVVEGDPKAPLSLATTLRCRRGPTPFLGITLYS